MATESDSSSSVSLFGDGDGGYAFKTLWKEITKAVTAVSENIVKGSQAYNDYSLGRLKSVTDWNTATTNSQSKNYVVIIIFALVIIGLLASMTFIKLKQK